MDKTVKEINLIKVNAEINIYDAIQPIINNLQKETGLAVQGIDIDLLDITCHDSIKPDMKVGAVTIKLNWEGGYE